MEVHTCALPMHVSTHTYVHTYMYPHEQVLQSILDREARLVVPIAMRGPKLLRTENMDEVGGGWCGWVCW